MAAGAGFRRAEALASKRRAGRMCKLSPAQLAELDAVPEAGPAACGYEDQCRALARITDLVWQRFGAEYTLAGTDALRPCRVERAGAGPAGRRAGRGGHRPVPIADVADGKRTAAHLGAWLVLEHEPGQGLRPPKRRTGGSNSRHMRPS